MAQTLSSDSSWMANGQATGDYFGVVVAGAGDLNGDGYDDVAVGAIGYNLNMGRVYVYHGSAIGLSATPALSLTGENIGDFFGRAVDGAGDVNNDGYDDLIVGADGWFTNTGRVYVYLGSAGGLSTAPVFTFDGKATGDRLGISVAGAGYINDDSYADILFGAYGRTLSTQDDPGAVYVLYGTSTGISAEGDKINGENPYDYFGSALDGAGDVDNDGYADIVVGADGWFTNTGKVYVFHGNSGSISTIPVLTTTGEAAGDAFGSAVAGAGDVDGDGYDDVLVAAPYYGSNNGRLYLYPGGSGGLGATPVFTATGQAQDFLGMSVSGAGDVNADGYDDVIVGASQLGSGAGEAYLYYGSATGLLSAVDLFTGENSGDQFGGAVAGAGDVNGDGRDGVLVGASEYQSRTGKAYLYRPTALADVPWDVLFRALQRLEEERNGGAAPGWAAARLGSAVQPLYRPDVSGVAYYDFPVIVPSATATTRLQATAPYSGTPAGFIVVSTGEHDFPIPNWSDAGESPTQRLAQLALANGERAARFFKLDTLSYVAENAQGDMVSAHGDMPPKVVGMDPAWLDDPPATAESTWTPDQPTSDDTDTLGITGTLVISGPVIPPSFQLAAWTSWDELKTGYDATYDVFAEWLRREASEAWLAEQMRAEYGIPLFKGETYIVSLVWPTPTVSLDGAGTGYVDTEMLTTTSQYAITVLDSVVGEGIPLTVTIGYQNNITHEIGFVIYEPYRIFLPFIGRNADAGMGMRAAAGQPTPAIRAPSGTTSTYWAGTHEDQCWYDQIPPGEDPNTSGCNSGCGATAWSMLFCWIDNQAPPSSGNAYWNGRWGLFRENGGYGNDALAPQVWGAGDYDGVKSMIWEIRGDIDTFCDPFSTNGPTLPADMAEARGYVSGRSGVRIENEYSGVGYPADSISRHAYRSIDKAEPYMATPAVIGTGFLAHYPLAYGYRRTRHTYCASKSLRLFCFASYEREFYVNQGWTDSREWVSDWIWFAGRTYPQTNWVDDVGVYRPSTGNWYYDYDHNGTTNLGPIRWGTTGELPAAGDLDRDGVIDDVVRYFPSIGLWVFDYDHDGSLGDGAIDWTDSYGGGLPVIGDFDRDGYADDVAVYRGEIDRRWVYDIDHDGIINTFSAAWGNTGDYPVAGDFDRDGAMDDVAVYRPSTKVWYFDYDHNGTTDETSGPVTWRGRPVAGDFDRDGFVDDVALFTSSDGEWHYDYDHNGTTDATISSWGVNGDLPFAGTFIE